MITNLRTRFHLWRLEPFGGLDLLQLLLLGLTLECVGLGLTSIVDRLSSDFMFMLTLAAVLTAFVLNHTRLPAWGYALTGTLLGALGLGLTVGQVSLVSWQRWNESLVILIARLDNWFRAVNAHTLVIDPLVTSLIWGMALWLTTLWAMWWVRRRASALVGLLPALTLLAYNTYYVNNKGGNTWLVLSVGLLLLLQSSSGYGQARQRWSAQHVEQEGIGQRLTLMVVVLVVTLSLTGSMLANIPYSQLGHIFDTALRSPTDQTVAESLGLEATPVGYTQSGTPAPNVQTGVDTSELHRIGPSPSLDQSLVMFVAVDGYNPPLSPSEYAARISEQIPHFYWRALTYDLYNGHTWTSESAHVEHAAANQSLRPNVDISSLTANYERVTQHITRLQKNDKTVFADGELLSLDQPAGILERDSGEIIFANTNADRYTAISRTQNVSVDQLRAAGTDYPELVRRYLQLPEGLPVRVLDLALNLTADQPTPYDKAAVLEAYLRQFPYSRQVPGPPADRDAVDYFLFDLKKGYCDYYASAMVVMARASGLPARMVLGYSEGTYDFTSKLFVVRASNAHAWAEIYFPNIGWVEFEPTASQPLPYRPSETQNDEPITDLLPPGREAPLSIHLERTWLGRLILNLLIVAAALSFVPFLPLERWWLSLLPVDQALQAIFRRLYRRGRSLGIQPTPSRTPNDFALAFDSAITKLPASKKHEVLISNLRSDLSCLISLYNRLLFSDHPPREEEKQQAIQAWLHFRRSLKQVRR